MVTHAVRSGRIRLISARPGVAEGNESLPLHLSRVFRRRLSKSARQKQ